MLVYCIIEISDVLNVKYCIMKKLFIFINRHILFQNIKAITMKHLFKRLRKITEPKFLNNDLVNIEN